jgi:hypothetical protein
MNKNKFKKVLDLYHLIYYLCNVKECRFPTQRHGR